MGRAWNSYADELAAAVLLGVPTCLGVAWTFHNWRRRKRTSADVRRDVLLDGLLIASLLPYLYVTLSQGYGNQRTLSLMPFGELSVSFASSQLAFSDVTLLNVGGNAADPEPPFQNPGKGGRHRGTPLDGSGDHPVRTGGGPRIVHGRCPAQHGGRSGGSTADPQLVATTKYRPARDRTGQHLSGIADRAGSTMTPEVVTVSRFHQSTAGSSYRVSHHQESPPCEVSLALPGTSHSLRTAAR